MPVEIGESSEPIPIHFAYTRDINIEAALISSGNSVADRPLRDMFDTPDLAVTLVARSGRILSSKRMVGLRYGAQKGVPCALK